MKDNYQHNQLQERQGASLALTTSVSAKNKDIKSQDLMSKPNVACRSENTRCKQRGRLSAHSVYVLNVDGVPLTPTTPAKARKLLKEKQACKIWSKFNTFGIKMLVSTRRETPQTSLGIDNGTKFEGYSVVVNKENNLSIKLDLPDKKKIVAKLKERREARKTRRSRLRRRPVRFQNRSRKGFISPSQLVIIRSRLKIIKTLCAIYPVSICGFEDVCFNHAKYRWGANFSTMEIGKTVLKKWIRDKSIELKEFKGRETSKLRNNFGYKKTSDKAENKFSSHCCDSLTLAVAVNGNHLIPEGNFLVIDDTYRCVRRKLHYSNLKKGGVREPYSNGIVKRLRKGLIIGTKKGCGQLCGENRGSFRYYDSDGKRQTVKMLKWVNNQFNLGKC